jgi:hypothetical protein
MVNFTDNKTSNEKRILYTRNTYILRLLLNTVIIQFPVEMLWQRSSVTCCMQHVCCDGGSINCMSAFRTFQYNPMKLFYFSKISNAAEFTGKSLRWQKHTKTCSLMQQVTQFQWWSHLDVASICKYLLHIIIPFTACFVNSSLEVTFQLVLTHSLHNYNVQF